LKKTIKSLIIKKGTITNLGRYHKLEKIRKKLYFKSGEFENSLRKLKYIDEIIAKIEIAIGI